MMQQVTRVDKRNKLQHCCYQHYHTLPHSYLQGLDHLETLEAPANLMPVLHLGTGKQSSNKYAEYNDGLWIGNVITCERACI
jgi:hypothetical protein